MNAIKKLREVFRPRTYMTPEEYGLKLLKKGLNPDGTPILDPTPIAPPIGYKKHPSMVEIIRDTVRSENLARLARESGAETFEESEDFEIGDEPPERQSPWENEFDPPLAEIARAVEEARAPVGGAGGPPPAAVPEAPPPPPAAPPAAPPPDLPKA